MKGPADATTDNTQASTSGGGNSAIVNWFQISIRMDFSIYYWGYHPQTPSLHGLSAGYIACGKVQPSADASYYCIGWSTCIPSGGTLVVGGAGVQVYCLRQNNPCK